MNRRTTILTTLSFLMGVALGNWLVPGVVLGSLFTPLAIVQTARRTIETKDLMRVDLGSWCEGKEVIIQLQDAGPGSSGKHYHPAHSFNWVIEGSEVHTTEGKPATIAKPGDVLHDRPGEVHETQNSAPVKLLLFRVIEKGKPVTTNLP